MIVPLSLTFSEDFGLLRKALCSAGAGWFSSYDNIPAALFAGVSQRCTIWIGQRSEPACFVTPMYRWRSRSRAHLMDNISYVRIEPKAVEEYGLPKLASLSEWRVLETLRHPPGKGQRVVLATSRHSRHTLGFSQAARNFVSVFREPPPCLDEKTLEEVPSSKIGYLAMNAESDVFASMVAAAGEVYFWYWLTRGDGFDVTSWVVSGFVEVLAYLSPDAYGRLAELGRLLDARRYEALVFKKNAGKYVGNFNYRGHFTITRRADLVLLAGLGLGRDEVLAIFDRVQRVLAINEFAGEKSIPNAVKKRYPARPPDPPTESRVFAEIDRALASSYGFTKAELDFIINDDIKYRMGGDAEADSME